MYYVYETHVGDIEITTTEKGNLYCAICNDCDRLLGTVTSRGEAYELINRLNVYETDYINQILDDTFGDETYKIGRINFLREICTPTFAKLMKKHMIRTWGADGWYQINDETNEIYFDTGTYAFEKCVKNTCIEMGINRYYEWYDSNNEEYGDILDKYISDYLIIKLFNHYNKEIDDVYIL